LHLKTFFSALSFVDNSIQLTQGDKQGI
jgi:hypothetical protein